MKKLLVVPVMLVALALGTGTANATSTLPPCPMEDSKNCIWDAQVQGNGQGRSFTNIDGVVHYWDETGTVPFYACGDTLPDGRVVGERSECVPADTSYPAPPVTVPVEPVPAPVVEPVAETVPAPVEVQQAPAPEGTAERVAAGEELAYTGVEDAALAGLAASILSGGVALVWLARRMRAE